ncbi:MAG: serine/threonine-protein kinase [Planctomycetota bacterium]
MSPDERVRMARLAELFRTARALDPAAQRAYLASRTGADAALVTELARLLAEDVPTQAADDLLPACGDFTVGDRVGSFVIVAPVGEGGMGSVFLAEQRQPVRRQVALKVIKPGMDSKAVLARFAVERQALALMDHPTIAKVFEAGATANGRPYFAMEYVQGAPITRFCDQQRLPLDDRLRLFGQVCGGVQHAHAKGVIHRDLTPNNLLVALVDGQPRAKIIDFGLARAIDRPLAARTLCTEQGAILGTPEYMSPEQAGIEGGDVDIRSDVYTLGVVLYELLTGKRPFESGELRGGGYDAMCRTIREKPPPRPSTKITTVPAETTAAAELRGTTADALVRRLRGDLDWVVLRCLEKDPARRYATVHELAADIQAHLERRPVQAHAPTTTYRLTKFVQRNRLLVIGVATLLLVLVGGIVGTSVGLARASTNLQLAEQRASDLETIAKFQESRLRDVDTAKMAVDLRRGLLDEARRGMQTRGIAPATIEQRTQELAEATDGVNFTDLGLQVLGDHVFGRALRAIDGELEAQPLIRARLLQATATTMAKLGLLEAATAPQEKALAIRRQELGDDARDTLESIGRTGLLLQARGRLPEAEAHLRDALARSQRVLGPDDRDTLNATENVAVLEEALGHLDLAEDGHRRALASLRLLFGDDDPDTLSTMNNLAALLKDRGAYDEAEELDRTALASQRRVRGDHDVDTLVTLNNLGMLLDTRNEDAEAEACVRQALAGFRLALGNDHPLTLNTLGNLGVLLQRRGHMEEAEKLLREALDGCRSALGEGHADTLAQLANLGVLLEARGKLDEAEACLRQELDGVRRARGDDHPETFTSMHNLGTLLQVRGRLDEAESLLRQALAGRRRHFDERHMSVLITLGSLGSVQLYQRKFEDAEASFRTALAGLIAVFGEDHDRTAMAHGNLGVVLRYRGQLDEAETHLRKAVAVLRERQGDDGPNTLASIHELGGVLRAKGRLREALACVREALVGFEARLGEAQPQTVAAARHAALLLQRVADDDVAAGEHARARDELLEAHALAVRAWGAEHEQTAIVVERITAMFDAWHAADPEAGHDREAESWRARRR